MKRRPLVGLDAALRIDHPCAEPTRPGLNNGAVCFRSVCNAGAAADRLLSDHTPVAGWVENHRIQAQGGAMKMCAVASLEMPVGATVPLRHISPDGHHLMLLDLKSPLKDGDRFPVMLLFEKAGAREVKVWVQTPRRTDLRPH